MYTTYYISSDFDVDLKRISAWIATHYPRWYLLFTQVVFTYTLLRFDIFHFFCDRGILPPPARMGLSPSELEILKRAGKRLYTYTYGADVRTRNRTLALGEFNLCMHCPEPGLFCICDDVAGAANIELIGRFATTMMAMGDMTAYVPDCKNLHFWPIDVHAMSFVGVEDHGERPLRVAHAPNHPHFKGTSYLEDAMERLQAEGFAVELIRVEGVPNNEVLKLFNEADIVAEQFISGFHGYTALEAMALGKPVICYLRDPDVVANAQECPIIQADPNTLYDVLKDCVLDRYDLVELGRRGRAYVEKFYSIEAVAARLGRLYLDTAGLPPRVARRILLETVKLESICSGAN